MTTHTRRAVVAALTLTMALAACGGSDEATSTSSDTRPPAAAAPSTTSGSVTSTTSTGSTPSTAPTTTIAPAATAPKFDVPLRLDRVYALPGIKPATANLTMVIPPDAPGPARKVEGICNPALEPNAAYGNGTFVDPQQITASLGYAVFWVTAASVDAAKTFMDQLATSTPGCPSKFNASNPASYTKAIPLAPLGDQSVGATFGDSGKLNSVFVRTAATVYRLDTIGLTGEQTVALASSLLPGSPAAGAADLQGLQTDIGAVAKIAVGAVGKTPAVVTQIIALTNPLQGQCGVDLPGGSSRWASLIAIAKSTTTGSPDPALQLITSRLRSTADVSAHMTALKALRARCTWKEGNATMTLDADPVTRTVNGTEVVDLKVLDGNGAPLSVSYATKGTTVVRASVRGLTTSAAGATTQLLELGLSTAV